MSKRYPEIDFIKGIMIFLVVFFHIRYKGGLKFEMNYVYNFVYSFHIPVFFLLSGFFVNTSKGLFDNIYSISRHILIPYIVFETVYIMCLYVAGIFGYSFANKISDFNVIVLLNKLLINPVGAYWYLHNLIIGLVLIYCTIKLFTEEYVKQVIVCGLIYFIISLLLDGFRFDSVMFLLLGYLLKCYNFKLKPDYIYVLPIALIALNCLPSLQRGSLASYVIVLFLIPFLTQLYIKLSPNIISRTLSYLGTNTLVIMLIHPIFLNICAFFYSFFNSFDNSSITYMFFSTSITVALSLLSSYLLDLIGISKLIFGKNTYTSIR